MIGEETPAAARPALPAVTGLRFVAAFAIILHHFRTVLPLPAAVLPWFEHARAAVSLFFILSGFLLVYRYIDVFRHDLGRFPGFMGARLARTLPMHLLVLVLMTPVTLWLLGAAEGTPPHVLLQSWLANAVLLHGFQSLGRFHIWNVPSWTISGLLFFYLVFPFFVRYLLAGVRRLRLLIGLALLLYAAEVGSFAVALWLFLRRTTPGDVWALDRFLWSPFLRLWECLLGCALGALFLALQHHLKESPASPAARLLGAARGRGLLVAVSLVGLALLAPVSDLLRPGPLAAWHWTPYILFSPVYCLLIVALAAGPSPLARPLEWGWLRRLGDASFTLYMIHWLPLSLLIKQAEAGAIPHPALSLGLLLGLTALSLPFHRFIERPLGDWLRRISLPPPFRPRAAGSPRR